MDIEDYLKILARRFGFQSARYIAEALVSELPPYQLNAQQLLIVIKRNGEQN